MKRTLAVVAVVSALAFAAGCTNTQKGAVIGGAAGTALGGAATGTTGGAIAGGVVGAGAGAIIGNNI